MPQDLNAITADRMAVYDSAQAHITHLQGLTAALRLCLDAEKESPQAAHVVDSLLLAMDHGTEWARAYIEGNLHPHVLEAEYDSPKPELIQTEE